MNHQQTDAKNLITISIIFFLITILHFVLSPNLLGPGAIWIVSTLLFLFMTVFFFTLSLKKSKNLNLLATFVTSLIILILMIALFLLILWLIVANNMVG